MRKARGPKDPAPGRFSAGYEAFIKGPVWAAYREVYFTRNIKACRVCKSMDNVELHHLNHQFYFLLKDAFFVPLCRTHHVDLTQKFQKRRDRRMKMDEFTKLYVATKGRGV